MNKTIKGKFLVIGGQYSYVFYGLKATERAAKILATKNQEYWDNWQGWHKPVIYELAEEIELAKNASLDDLMGVLRERADKLGYRNLFALKEFFQTEIFVH